MIIGITGGIGSGKSTIAQIIVKDGFLLYDTDKEAKRLIVEDPQLRTAIVDLLGADVYEGNTYLTQVVAQRVFTNPELLKQLNALVHPFVERDIKNLSASETSGPSAQRSASETVHQRSGLLIESALLFESGLNQLCDYVIVVTAPETIRIARTIARDQTTEQKVRDRMAAQMDEQERCRLADFVYENVGPIHDDRVHDVIWSWLGKVAQRTATESSDVKKSSAR